jgi:DNA-binding XRE family transcriptional regulator
MEAATGIDHMTIWRAESGKEPSLTNALRIAKALKYPVEELWELS